MSDVGGLEGFKARVDSALTTGDVGITPDEGQAILDWAKANLSSEDRARASLHLQELKAIMSHGDGERSATKLDENDIGRLIKGLSTGQMPERRLAEKAMIFLGAY